MAKPDPNLDRFIVKPGSITVLKRPKPDVSKNTVSSAELDPQRGQAVAAKLKKLRANKKLIRAAEQGYITELACKMPRCRCPEELGGRTYFEPVTADWSDWRTDWMPTREHFPIPKREGGGDGPENTILAHRLCNRIDHSIAIGRSHRRDLERIERAREEGLRRKNAAS